jgi:predicted nucleic acid-binding protein
MKRWFADSFFFLALLSERDRAHQRAVQIADHLDSGLVTTEWVLAEVADALSSPPVRSKCLALFEFLKSHPLVTIVQASHDHFERGLELYASRSDKDWPLTDCVSFVAMRELGLTEVLTGDRHFEQAGFQILLGKETV